MVNLGHIAQDDIREALQELSDRITKLENAKAAPKKDESKSPATK